MLLSPKKTIEIEKLMVTQDTALAKTWDNSKQKQWGEFTAGAVDILSVLLKDGKLKNLSDAYGNAIKFRKIIGTILNHSADVGMPRDCIAMTPIENCPESGYRLVYPEFKSMVEHLRSKSDEIPNVVLNDDKITLKEKFEQEDYERSSVKQLKNNDFEIYHSNNIGLSLTLASRFFNNLITIPNLTAEEKRLCINKIFYHVADAMPVSRGNASIIEILYHALEKAYTDKISYFGKPKSDHHHAQGVSADLSAILAPNYQAFSDYFNKNILDNGTYVASPTERTAISEAQKIELKNNIENMIKHLDVFEKQLTGSLQFLLRNISDRYLSSYQDLLSLINLCGHEDDQSLSFFYKFEQALSASLANNKMFFPAFYQSLEDKSEWHTKIVEQKSKHQYTLEKLNQLQVTVNEIHVYFEKLAYILGYDCDNPFVAAHFTCKNIQKAIQDYNAHFLGTHKNIIKDDAQFEATMQHLVASDQKFKNCIDQYQAFLSVLEKGKKEGTKENTLASWKEMVKGMSQNVMDHYINIFVRNQFDNYYENAQHLAETLNDFLNAVDIQPKETMNANCGSLLQQKRKI